MDVVGSIVSLESYLLPVPVARRTTLVVKLPRAATVTMESFLPVLSCRRGLEGTTNRGEERERERVSSIGQLCSRVYTTHLLVVGLVFRLLRIEQHLVAHHVLSTVAADAAASAASAAVAVLILLQRNGAAAAATHATATQLNAEQ